MTSTYTWGKMNESVMSMEWCVWAPDGSPMAICYSSSDAREICRAMILSKKVDEASAYPKRLDQPQAKREAGGDE